MTDEFDAGPGLQPTVSKSAELDREATERRIKELVEESLVAARDRQQLEAEIIEAMLGGPR